MYKLYTVHVYQVWKTCLIKMAFNLAIADISDNLKKVSQLQPIKIFQIKYPQSFLQLPKRWILMIETEIHGKIWYPINNANPCAGWHLLKCQGAPRITRCWYEWARDASKEQYEFSCLLGMEESVEDLIYYAHLEAYLKLNVLLKRLEYVYKLRLHIAHSYN